MRIISILVGILVFLGIACGGGVQSQPVGTPLAEIPTSTPTTIPEAPTPDGSHFRDPTGEDILGAREIYQNLPKPLPEGPNYKIEYQESPSGTAGMFHITVTITTSANYRQSVEEALNFFRRHGYEPCEPPLAGVISIVTLNPTTAAGPPLPGSESWEPCPK